MKKKTITEIDILNKATEILERPNAKGFGWTQHALAKNLHGQTEVSSKGACRFCSVGVIKRAAFELGVEGALDHFNPPPAVNKAKRRLSVVMGGNIILSNDASRTTFPQVLIAFDLAKTDAGLAY